MPEEWGASGARLSLPLEVLIESGTSDTGAAESDFLGGSSASKLTVLEDPTHVTMKGQEQVEFADFGAWKMAMRRSGKAGDASRLRFWVELDKAGNGATRNDVSLKAGERLYFVTNGWRQDEVAAGLRRYVPLEASVKEAQARIDGRLSHESGDRRLDGTNPVDTAMASIDMAVLVKVRDDALQKLKDAERVLPLATQLSAPGVWPGSSERLLMAPGTIGVKRRNGIFGAEEYHIVGTWTATPLEGLSELVDEEDEAEITGQ